MAVIAVGTWREAAPSPTARAPGDVLISNVATHLDHRRQGHSRAAIGQVLVWAASIGAGRVELVATADGAVRYESIGFVASAWPLMRRSLAG